MVTIIKNTFISHYCLYRGFLPFDLGSNPKYLMKNMKEKKKKMCLLKITNQTLHGRLSLYLL